ncbi:hypothetical protein ACFYNF_27335 [Streptomyces sp. NPDC006641]|uniref:hypothetical protein n=1 Tax=unclassified Streptomyces TaxID=2593676 RepID=UPI002E7843C4|nr:hypothetical protein [Streptomyces sp. JV184]MEE1745002.1 hypothetical protein [Streptomyces sp. JV184]
MAKLAVKFTRDFEVSFGYPPGDNGVVRADSNVRRDLIDGLIEAGVGGDLISFFSRVGSVSLPDLDSGFFIHSAEDLLDGVRGEQPVRITGALEDEIAVFGSDGGGALFALNAAQDRVYRLSGGALVGATYDVNPSGVQVMADDLWGFLEYLLSELSRAVSVD